MNSSLSEEALKAEKKNSIRRSILEEEGGVQQVVDEFGNLWTKVYFDSEMHLNSWVNKYLESTGKIGVKLEEIDSLKVHCFEIGGEKLHRIWVKEQK